jgi:hypothetical protein
MKPKIILCLALMSAVPCRMGQAQAGPSASSGLPQPEMEADQELGQLDSVNGMLDQFIQTKSPQLLVDASAKMKGVPFPPDGVGKRDQARAWLRTWLRIMAMAEANKDLSLLAKGEVGSINICVPGDDGRQYPSGTDPKDVKDPATRAAYIKALEENDKILKRVYLQSQVRRIWLGFTFRMQVYLGAYFKTPEEKNEAKELVTQSDLSDATRTILLDSLNKP